jgi:hypothetical protein
VSNTELLNTYRSTQGKGFRFVEDHSNLEKLNKQHIDLGADVLVNYVLNGTSKKDAELR